MALTVGQTLWLVVDHGRALSREVTVSKIGRRWATLDQTGMRLRIDKETLGVDGDDFWSPGRCWLSREAYEIDRETRHCWALFRDAVSRRKLPLSASAEDIRQAAKLLGIAL